MTVSPRISVITVFFNAGDFIQEAIDSIFAQTYQDWELLLVDDGSTDNSTDIALSLTEQHPKKVRYLEHGGHQNRGISAAQNLGLRHARGEYIAFLDADDVWLPRKLEQQVRILDSWPDAAMLYGHTQYWYSWTGKIEDMKRDLHIEPGVEPDTLVMPPLLLVSFLRGQAAIPCPSDVLVRRERVESVGGFEDGFRHIFTDQVFYAKLCLKAPVFVSSQCWFKYRKHADSSVSRVKKAGHMRDARLTYLNWLENYLHEQGNKDQNVHKAINHARRKCRHPTLSSLSEQVRYRASVWKEAMKAIARRILPTAVHRWVRDHWLNQT
jgi:glycosyltransferase involved in cell wall biosynthesis